jgi:3-hydroxyisobutyrate dehydrogenase-like beta-hydroxyacid dehydrogenase
MAALHDVAANIAASPTPNAIVMETSTMPLEDKIKMHDTLAAAGVTLLDCPVSGTSVQALAKELGVYLSGDEAAAKACEPVAEAIGKAFRYVGEFGNGSKMKFVANCLVAVHTAAAAEAMAMGVKGGLDAELIYDVITNTSPAASSAMFGLRGKLMVEDNYPSQMPLHLFKKDTTVIGDFGKSVGAEMPLFAQAEALYARARKGHPDEDIAAVFTVLK